MRTLVMGIPLPHVSFDNYSFLSAPSLSEYQCVIVEMEGVSRAVQGVLDGEGEQRTFTGQQVVNGEASAAQFPLSQVLAMRQREATWALGRGAVVVCFAHPDARHVGVHDRGDWRRYEWLPEPQGSTYEELLFPAFGREGAQVVDAEHPFAAFGEGYGPRLAYRVQLDEQTAGFGEIARVFLRSPAGVAIGAELKVREGSVIILPPLLNATEGRIEVAECLFQCLERWQSARTPEAQDALGKEAL
jgi:hypothetical protein